MYLDFGVLCRVSPRQARGLLIASAHIRNGRWTRLATSLQDMGVIGPDVDAAAALAARLLRPGGAFVAKLFRCTDAALVEAQLRCLFVDVDVRKPASSRDRSVEAFVVARDFRGGCKDAGFLEKGDLGFAATAAEPPGLAVAAAWT